MKTITFLGNRPSDLGGFILNNIQKKIQSKIEEIIALDKDVLVVTSLSLGIEMQAGLIAKKLKVPYKVVVPYENYSSRWNKYDQINYTSLIKGAAHKQVLSSGGFDSAKLKEKDVVMLDQSDQIYIAYNSIPKLIYKYIKMGKTVFDIMPQGEEDDHFISI